eukprot:Pompholyxophrys_sp_v1_NODE_60_length_2776_cov_39.857773.p2 type:complete len:121 gc:universal NODE_60_length_2776_cov_39.857773:2437-2075(-)
MHHWRSHTETYYLPTEVHVVSLIVRNATGSEYSGNNSALSITFQNEVRTLSVLFRNGQYHHETDSFEVKYAWRNGAVKNGCNRCLGVDLREHMVHNTKENSYAPLLSNAKHDLKRTWLIL